MKKKKPIIIIEIKMIQLSWLAEFQKNWSLGDNWTHSHFWPISKKKDVFNSISNKESSTRQKLEEMKYANNQPYTKPNNPPELREKSRKEHLEEMKNMKSVKDFIEQAKEQLNRYEKEFDVGSRKLLKYRIWSIGLCRIFIDLME